MRGAGLDDTSHISVEEKVLIRIQVCRGLSNRDIGQRLQHSGVTISKILRDVCTAMRASHHLFMVVPDATTPLDGRIANDPKLFPCFDGCLGAWDGAHVPAIVTGVDAEGGSFRDCKPNIAQNVLKVVNFDMTCTWSTTCTTTCTWSTTSTTSSLRV